MSQEALVLLLWKLAHQQGGSSWQLWKLSTPTEGSKQPQQQVFIILEVNSLALKFSQPWPFSLFKFSSRPETDRKEILVVLFLFFFPLVLIGFKFFCMQPFAYFTGAEMDVSRGGKNDFPPEHFLFFQSPLGNAMFIRCQDVLPPLPIFEHFNLRLYHIINYLLFLSSSEIMIEF